MAIATNVLTAARCRLYFKGVPFALALNFQATRTIQRVPIRPMGQLEAEGFAPTSVEVSGSIGTVVLAGKDPVAAGIYPNMGGTSEQVVSAVIAFGGDDVDIFDIDTQTMVGKVRNFTPNNLDMNLSPGAAAQTSITFQGTALLFQSELE